MISHSNTDAQAQNNVDISPELQLTDFSGAERICNELESSAKETLKCIKKKKRYNFELYHLSDVEHLPALSVQGHQSGSDEVSSPWLHSAVQHLIQIHLQPQINRGVSSLTCRQSQQDAFSSKAPNPQLRTRGAGYLVKKMQNLNLSSV